MVRRLRLPTRTRATALSAIPSMSCRMTVSGGAEKGDSLVPSKETTARSSGTRRPTRGGPQQPDGSADRRRRTPRSDGHGVREGAVHLRSRPRESTALGRPDRRTGLRPAGCPANPSRADRSTHRPRSPGRRNCGHAPPPGAGRRAPRLLGRPTRHWSSPATGIGRIEPDDRRRRPTPVAGVVGPAEDGDQQPSTWRRARSPTSRRSVARSPCELPIISACPVGRRRSRSPTASSTKYGFGARRRRPGPASRVVPVRSARAVGLGR